MPTSQALTLSGRQTGGIDDEIAQALRNSKLDEDGAEYDNDFKAALSMSMKEQSALDLVRCRCPHGRNEDAQMDGGMEGETLWLLHSSPLFRSAKQFSPISSYDPWELQLYSHSVSPHIVCALL